MPVVLACPGPAVLLNFSDAREPGSSSGGPTFNLADAWLLGGLLIAVGGWLWQR
jgi:hypothetical protein